MRSSSTNVSRSRADLRHMASAQNVIQIMHPPEARAAAAASLAQVSRVRHGHAMWRRSARLRDTFVDEERIHVRVGHPLFRADDGAIDLAVDEAAFAVDLDVDGKREPLHARVERTDAVR